MELTCTHQTVSEQNEEFTSCREELLQGFMALEWSDAIGTPCACATGLPRSYRCTDCSGTPTSCVGCLKENHALLPFHSAEKWNGSHFERVALGSIAVGVKLFLGHEGAPCPALAVSGTAEDRDGKEMTIAHLNGHHVVRVVRCLCRGARSDEQGILRQLLRARLFPGTLTRPTTAYTLELMEHWHLESLQSKKSTWDYWQALCQKTKRGLDRVRGFRSQTLTTDSRHRKDISRSSVHVATGGSSSSCFAAVRRTGSTPIFQRTDGRAPSRWFARRARSRTSTCSPTGEIWLRTRRTGAVEFARNWVLKMTCRFKLRAWHGTDATFKPYLKAKRQDDGDVSLLDGQAFFPTRAAWEAYCEGNEELPQVR